MEWDQGLFMAFMAATMGVLWWIALEVHQLRKDIKIERCARNRSPENPSNNPQANDNHFR